MRSRSCSGISTRPALATVAFGIGLVVLLTACGEQAQPPATTAVEPQTPAAEPETPTTELQTPAVELETPVDAQSPASASDSDVAATDPRPFQDLETADILNLNQRWTGDYDELAEP